MQAIGEVLSSRITSYTAEAWAQDDDEHTSNAALPFFGCFIKSRSENKRLTVYGVVYDIVTGAARPNPQTDCASNDQG